MSGAFDKASSRLRFFFIGAVVGAVLVVLALGFLVFAGYLALVKYLAPWLAALAVAGAALVLGGIFLLLAVKSLGKAVDQAKTAVRANALVTAAPVAARLAARNPRLVAGVAASAAALIALWRAFRQRRAEEG